MTVPRYLALLGEDQRLERLVRQQEQGWDMLLDLPGLKVAAHGVDGALTLPDGKGLILGPIYTRFGSTAVRRAESLPELLAARGAAGLAARHWGDWVAFLRDSEGRPSVVRAPFGALPCWYAASATAVLFSSDFALLRRAGLAGGVDWRALGRALLFDGVRSPETCVHGIWELAGGAELLLEGHTAACRPAWSPWEVLATAAPFDDAPTASDRLRDIILECVAARARERGRILLRLSGGLDSSIVAAALARSGAAFDCLNLVSADRSGDEREYARAVALALGSRLEEVVREVAGCTLDRSPSAHLPRPTIRSFSFESDRIARQVAARSGADTFFDGGGGDNIFCSLQSVAPIIDRLRTTGFDRAARATARDVCILSQSKLFTVWRRALARNARRAPDRLWRGDPSLLAPAFVAEQPACADHPWLRAPPDILPGQAAHVALLLAATDALGDRDPASLPGVAPLLSQPIVELCLRIPSWMWMEGGQNRIVARRAFAPMLPQEVAFRRGKGSPEGFVAQLFAPNRDKVLAQILDGMLAAHGLIDRPAIEALARLPTARIGDSVPRLMRLHDAEIWARNLEGVGTAH